MFEGIPEESRDRFWHKCLGIQSYKQNYIPDYYSTLCEADGSGAWEQYPNQNFGQIDKDLGRTFPSDAFYTEEIKQSMRCVLRAYIWRNPTVGYIQGMGFPFFRLRKFLSEEDTFWALCIVIESYLPPDFYVEMYGATSHATILQKICQ